MPAAASRRLFVALWPDAPTRAALQACQAGLRWPADARPVAAAQLHLTLHFLGAVPAADVAGLADALARPCGTLDFALDRFERWPGGTAVLTPSRPPAGLLALQRALGDALRGAGRVPEARAFRPHVTLARRAPDLAGASPAALHWHSQGYGLAQSDGGRYRLLRHYGPA